MRNFALDNESTLSSQHMKLQKFKRSYKACLNCRLRKIKCDLGSVDNPREGKCARCLRERKDCIFVDSKRGGSGNVAGGKRKKMKVHESLNDLDQIIESDTMSSYSASPKPSNSIHGNPDEQDELKKRLSVPHILNEGALRSSKLETHHHSTHHTRQSEGHFSTSASALVYLAKAAGSIAKADERDNIDARRKHEHFLKDSRNNSSDKLNNSSSGIERDSMSSDDTSFQKFDSYRSFPSGKSSTDEFFVVPPAETTYDVHPKGSTTISSFDFINGPNAILSVNEAEKLVNLFFSTMHPYFPYLPNFLHSPDALAEFPILLCTILTISSRYHTLTDDRGNDRNIEVHERLWVYVQRLISQTVWAEASTRSIGTIFAFLLFTEWNPRAIHWRWSDYANKADESSHAPNSEDQNLAGLGAMTRSYRMTWMLVGNAVRLAQEMGFMEVSSKTFLATHIAEVNSVMNIRGRSMLAQSLSEVDLDNENSIESDAGNGRHNESNLDDDDNDNGNGNDDDDDDDDDDDYDFVKLGEDDLKRLAEEHVLKFTINQKALLELLQIISLGHESFYGYKAQLNSLTQSQKLSVLSILSSLIGSWRRKYQNLLIPSNPKHIKNNMSIQQHILDPHSKISKEIAQTIEREEMIFNFHYVQLYVYSLALSPAQRPSHGKSSEKVSLKLDEISKSAKYIEQAFVSANELLSSAHRVHRIRMLRFMPVRWLTTIVRAIAFIVKCYMTITAHKKSSSYPSTLGPNVDNLDATILSLSMISIDDITQSIRRAAITLRDCSPDELHLCTRYSNILMYLCSQMKSTSKGNENADQDYPEPTNTEKAHAEENGPNNSVETSSNFTQNPTNTYNVQENGPGFFYFNNNENDGTPIQDIGTESEVMDWFLNNKDIGLDFVGPWTEMIEQQLNSNEQG
ncbi:uncharacterized protein PRCAT00000643001 [Priceomyces carsonii]|uniref:uncharacterized protein n=1 Tax=Priceomyces carsonii TaxID=28549 RepID=UPI002EDA4328|nr:unnamed protein product [Priceomyces carsonii]